MEISADNTNKLLSVEKFYQDYISRSEELRAAIQRREWSDVECYVTWREERLAELSTLPLDSTELKELHKEYLNRIMVLEFANIQLVNEMMESLKTSIRESQDHKLIARYAEHA